MSNVAIRVENISKRYTIGKTSHGSLRETLSGLFSKASSGPTEEFYALRDVSFEVNRGEAIGIIGKNGAGKSTLLKVLSRITEPTTGRIEIDGRVSSLLEVGTGFHPELTGRENVFLNGTILGMSRTEVKRKFDEIVDFSGVEKFLDTPVKRYSSGMTVRLAFAVAAHLEPEILIIDEVLAVGDAEFQKKCLGKMEDVAGEGRTVIFVSHNMGAVENLCTRGILLKNGLLLYGGRVTEAINLYGQEGSQNIVDAIATRKDRIGNGQARVSSIAMKDPEGKRTNTISMGDGLSVSIEVEGFLENAIIGILIGNQFQEQILRGYTYESYNKSILIDGKLTVECCFENINLVHGIYNVHTWVGQFGDVADYVENAAKVEVLPKDVFNTGKILDAKRVQMYSPHRWTFTNESLDYEIHKNIQQEKRD